MATNTARRNVTYGMTNPLQNIGPLPIVSPSSSPSTSNIAELGTVWIKKSTSQAWILAKISGGSATWTPLTVNAGATIATGDLTVTTGDITVTAGDITANSITGTTLYADDDKGGVAVTVGFTNVTDEALSIGAGTVLMTTGNPEDSTGWLKIYVGTDVRYIPYWTNIAP